MPLPAAKAAKAWSAREGRAACDDDDCDGPGWDEDGWDDSGWDEDGWDDSGWDGDGCDGIGWEGWATATTAISMAAAGKASRSGNRCIGENSPGVMREVRQTRAGAPVAVA